MIEIDIPGFKRLGLEHLVLDYNGTVAVDGCLLAGVKDRLRDLGEHLRVHIITADTFGQVSACVADLTCSLHVLPPGNQAEAKRDYLRALDPGKTVCIGNGRNDRLMLQEAALGIAVMLAEGACSNSITASDVVCGGIEDALDLLLHPLRLIATLRS